jgi:hypothetical protein
MRRLLRYQCRAGADRHDTSPTGTRHAVFGGGNWQCGLQHYFEDVPFATPAQIQQRMGALANYVDDFAPSGTEWAPYTDLDTQLWGDYENRTGFWAFWDNEYDDFVAAGLLAPKQGDPTHWLLRKPTLNTDPACALSSSSRAATPISSRVCAMRRRSASCCAPMPSWIRPRARRRAPSASSRSSAPPASPSMSSRRSRRRPWAD